MGVIGNGSANDMATDDIFPAMGLQTIAQRTIGSWTMDITNNDAADNGIAEDWIAGDACCKPCALPSMGAKRIALPTMGPQILGP